MKIRYAVFPGAAIKSMIVGLVLVGISSIHQPAAHAQNAAAKSDYGNNAAAGATVSVNGIKMYVETYGKGEPLLLIHGNGGNIASMSNQIKYFSTKYLTIAADSRGHGKSEMGEGRLTYEKMAEDLNAMLDKKGIKSTSILGWSDGGILGLLLAIHHPDKVQKLAIMGANLRPSGAYSWALDFVAKQNKAVDAMLAKGDNAKQLSVIKQYLDLLGNQPNIPVNDLGKITAPTLVMAGDRDVIRGEHSLEIFEHIKNSHLCIFPGATHMIPATNSAEFNRVVNEFLSAPFTMPDTKALFQ